jgi:hypothetical protein
MDLALDYMQKHLWSLGSLPLVHWMVMTLRNISAGTEGVVEFVV